MRPMPTTLMKAVTRTHLSLLLGHGPARLLSTAPAKKVAVILSGCGVYDGAEVTEATSTLIHLSAAGCEAIVFAPDKDQAHVVDHTKGEEMPQPRNIMVESARIARGQVSPLSEINVNDYSALLIPGGFGAAKNLCNHAMVCIQRTRSSASCGTLALPSRSPASSSRLPQVAQGDPAKMEVDADVLRAIKGFSAANKPIGLCCIAPVIAASVLKCKVTVGQADGDGWPYGGTVAAVENYGGTHEAVDIDGVCIDAAAKVVTTPAYMYEGKAHEIYNSVGKMVTETLKLA